MSTDTPPSGDGKTRPPAPKWLKPTVDYGPLAVFGVAYWLYGFMPATAALIGASGVVLVLSLAIERRVPIVPVVTAAVVGVFGGLTLWLQDPTWVKMKPTIVQAIMAAILLGGLAIGKPLLRPLLGTALSMDHQGWVKLTMRFGLFFIVMAVLNEIVWRTQSQDFWVAFKLFGITGMTLVFAISQAPMMTRHQLAEEEENTQNSSNDAENV